MCFRGLPLKCPFGRTTRLQDILILPFPDYLEFAFSWIYGISNITTQASIDTAWVATTNCSSVLNLSTLIGLDG
jgi:hypothetical protein